MNTITTKNDVETKQVAYLFAQEILASLSPSSKHATIIALSGNLGAGKTTFSQGFAQGLNIKTKIKSPTFVIMKRYKMQACNMQHVTCNKKHEHKKTCYMLHDTYYKFFFHIDCYRLENEKDAEHLEFKEIFKNPENLILIEWPEKIKKLLPKEKIVIKFKHVNEQTRKISFN